MKFRNKRACKYKQKNQKKVFKHAERHYWRNSNVNRNKNNQRENKMDCPSFQGFRAQSESHF